MQIVDLKRKYPKVYRAALANQVQQGNEANDCLNIRAAPNKGGFDWIKSLEGLRFWDYVDRGNFEQASHIVPEYFVMDKPSKDSEIKEEVKNLRRQVASMAGQVDNESYWQTIREKVKREEILVNVLKELRNGV